MSDLYNTALSQNALNFKPTTELGTRELVLMVLYADADFWNGGNYTDPDTDYAKAVRAIQLSSELYFLGPPTVDSQDSFIFGVAVNTSDWNYQEGDFSDDSETQEYPEPTTLYNAFDDLYNGDFDLYKLNAYGDIIE
jgi:hypothetical protein